MRVRRRLRRGVRSRIGVGDVVDGFGAVIGEGAQLEGLRLDIFSSLVAPAVKGSFVLNSVLRSASLPTGIVYWLG